MDDRGATLLYTLAGLMVTLAGFSAILLSVRQATGAQVSVLDRYLARTVLVHLFALTAGALLPPILSLYGLTDDAIWKTAAALFGLPMLLMLLTYPQRRRKVVGTLPPAPILAVLVVLGATVMAAMLVYVWAGFQYDAAAYVTAVAVNFFTTAFAFITALEVIFKDSDERSH
jgi:hypothetical protein